MLNVKTISFAAVLSAALASTNVCAYEFEKVAPETVGFDSVKLENADTKLKQLYLDGRIPNYVLNLYKDGKLYYSATGGLTNLFGLSLVLAASIDNCATGRPNKLGAPD